MNDAHEKIAQFLSRNVRLYVVASGAGAGIQEAIWEVPGCSSFFAGASFPYATEEVDAFLGFQPERYASPETALDFAMEAYMRAVKSGSDADPIGVGLTASVASLTEHRGDHRIHVAVMTKDKVLGRDIILNKGVGVGKRAIDGRIADQVGLEALLVGAGLLPNTDEPFVDRTTEARARFFLRPYFTARGERLDEACAIPSERRLTTCIFPGTFNPPHGGHIGMAKAASEWRPRWYVVLFSITVDPPHKDPVSLGEMCRRAKLLAGQERVFTQGDALYLDKAKRHPGSVFLIGADAAIRMFDPKWTADAGALAWEFLRRNVTFLVATRQDEAGVKGVDDVWKLIPSSCHTVFKPLPGQYPWDLSSSAIRAGAVPAPGART